MKKKKIFAYSNCLSEGLLKFMNLHPTFSKQFETEYIASFRIPLGENSVDQVISGWREADIIFHHVVDNDWGCNTELFLPYTKPTAEVYSLPVIYNSGFFIHPDELLNSSLPNIKSELSKSMNHAISYFWNYGDLNWSSRFDSCLDKMKQKEINEGVIEQLRMSSFINEHSHDRRTMITCNHPTTFTFAVLAYKIADLLELPPWPQSLCPFKIEDINYAQLPCYDYISPAAKMHLGLKYNNDHYSVEVENHIKMVLSKFID